MPHGGLLPAACGGAPPTQSVGFRSSLLDFSSSYPCLSVLQAGDIFFFSKMLPQHVAAPQVLLRLRPPHAAGLNKE
jgi:hypothetical protein